VTDLAPLHDCKLLTTLNLADAPVSPASIDALRSALPSLKVNGQPVGAAAPGAAPGVPAPAATAASTVIKGPVNLLRLIDLSQHVVDGKWSNANGALVGGGVNLARVLIPLTPPSEYDITLAGQMVGVSKAPTPALRLGFVADGKQSYIYLCPDRAGIGIQGNTNNKYLVTGKSYPVNRPFQLVCSVRKESITATLNGEKLVEYKEDFASFGLGPGLTMPSKDQLFVSTSRWCKEMTVQFHHAVNETHYSSLSPAPNLEQKVA
jgi:hypothetical protein